MDGGIATLWAAVIGLVTGGGSALVSGVLAYKAGRKQVKDQGLSAHSQWLCQQRQEAYVAHLSACDAFVNAVDECVLALGTAEAASDFSLYDGAMECVDLAVYRTVEIRDGDVDHQLGRILMLGPAEVSESANSLRSNVRAVQQDVAHLANALIPRGPEPPGLGPLDDWWSKVEHSKDQLLASRSAFIAHAQATLTNPRVSS